MQFRIAILVILLCPVFFINIKDSHDWGDDFAQYIQQAINFSQGKPENYNAYIYNPEYPIYAPPLYPVGYPLLLSPVCRLFGNNIRAFNYWQTLILFLLGIVLFFFFRRFMAYSFALLLTLVCVYNPWILNFKRELISDLPFTLFILASILAFLRFQDEGKNSFAFMAALAAGYAALIKPIGLIMAPAFVLASISSYYKNRSWKSTGLITVLLLAIFPLVIYFGISKALLPFTGVGHFWDLYKFEKVNKLLNGHSVMYMDMFQRLFSYTNPDWDFLVMAFRAFVMCFFLLGFFGKIINRFGFLEIVMLLFIPLVLLFPTAGQGFRYMLPVFPLMMLYVYHGFESVNVGKLNRKVVFLTACFICIFQYKTSIEKMVRNRDEILSGPQDPVNQEAFEFIKNNTEHDAVIIYSKPRALGLYTQRVCTTNAPDQSVESMTKFFKQNNANYILLEKQYPFGEITSYLQSKAEHLDTVWENSRFFLLRTRS